MRWVLSILEELIPRAWVWLDPGITPCVKTQMRDRRMVGQSGNFRLSDFDGRAEKHELLRRGLRPAWPPSGAGHPRWRSHASDCRPERGGSSLFGPFRGFWS